MLHLLNNPSPWSKPRCCFEIGGRGFNPCWFVMPVSARIGRGTGEVLISKECGGVGHWDCVSLILAFQVEELFSPLQWRRSWRRFAVPVSVCGRGKEREAPISERCSGYCLQSPPQMVGWYLLKVSSSRSILCQGINVGDEYIQQDRL